MSIKNVRVSPSFRPLKRIPNRHKCVFTVYAGIIRFCFVLYHFLFCFFFFFVIFSVPSNSLTEFTQLNTIYTFALSK